MLLIELGGFHGIAEGPLAVGVLALIALVVTTRMWWKD
jgi:hypothetical protein